MKSLKSHIYKSTFFCYNTIRYAAVAQLDRVPDSDSGGRGFESRQPYYKSGFPFGSRFFIARPPN